MISRQLIVWSKCLIMIGLTANTTLSITQRHVFTTFSNAEMSLNGGCRMREIRGGTFPKQHSQIQAHFTDTEWGQTDHTKTTPISSKQIGEEDETVEIAIIGGGLAGLALAVGLSRAKIPFRLYEKAPKLRTFSQGMLVVEVNGLKALQSIHPDLPDKVLESGALMKSIHSIAIDDSGIATTREGNGIDEERRLKYDGLAPVLIRWSALQNVLASFLPADSIVAGKSINAFEETDDNVIVRFDDGHFLKCNCLIGCDGTFSVVREQMLKSIDDRPVFFGQMNWNAIVPTDSLPVGLMNENQVRVIMSSGNPRWSTFINDCGGGYTFWQLRVTDPNMSMQLSKSNGRGGLGLVGIKDTILDIVAASEDMQAVIQATPEAIIFERAIVGRTVASSWRSTRGRVTLVGDAAHGVHPVVGQGANLAFESVKYLIDEIVNCTGDWKAGFESYENKRRKRVDLIQTYCNFVGCIQATGSSTELSQSLRKEVTDWIHRCDLNEDPPNEMLELIKDFDLLAQPCVSLL